MIETMAAAHFVPSTIYDGWVVYKRRFPLLRWDNKRNAVWELRLTKPQQAYSAGYLRRLAGEEARAAMRRHR